MRTRGDILLHHDGNPPIETAILGSIIGPDRLLVPLSCCKHSPIVNPFAQKVFLHTFCPALTETFIISSIANIVSMADDGDIDIVVLKQKIIEPLE